MAVFVISFFTSTNNAQYVLYRVTVMASVDVILGQAKHLYSCIFTLSEQMEYLSIFEVFVHLLITYKFPHR